MISSDRISKFIVATGPRGSHKTLLQTGLACERLIKCYWGNKYPDKFPYLTGTIWTNYPIGFWYKSHMIPGMRSVYLESQPLNQEALITFDDELTRGWVFIDEIDLWADRQEWMAVSQKLLSAVFQQIRKKKLNLMATIQNFNWLNERLQFQADILVKCREAAFTPWGAQNKVDLGEVSFLEWMDKSGVMTGYTYDETNKKYPQIFLGRRYWDCYDTDYQFDVLASKTKYRLKSPEKTIFVGGGNGERLDNAVSIGKLHSEKINRNEVILADLIQEFKDKGMAKIPASAFWTMARNKGFAGNSAEGNRIMLSKFGLAPISNIFRFEIPDPVLD